jgi:hypothetical protein
MLTLFKIYDNVLNVFISIYEVIISVSPTCLVFPAEGASRYRHRLTPSSADAVHTIPGTGK